MLLHRNILKKRLLCLLVLYEIRFRKEPGLACTFSSTAEGRKKTHFWSSECSTEAEVMETLHLADLWLTRVGRFTLWQSWKLWSQAVCSGASWQLLSLQPQVTCCIVNCTSWGLDTAFCLQCFWEQWLLAERWQWTAEERWLFKSFQC